MIEPSGQAGIAKRRLGMVITEILVTQDKGQERGNTWLRQ